MVSPLVEIAIAILDHLEVLGYQTCEGRPNDAVLLVSRHSGVPFQLDHAPSEQIDIVHSGVSRNEVISYEWAYHWLIRTDQRRVSELLKVSHSLEAAELSVSVVAGQAVVTSSLNVQGRNIETESLIRVPMHFPRIIK